MTKPQKLTLAETQEQLTRYPGWRINASGQLEREFVFADFKHALMFINIVGWISEKLNHHADIFNVYNKVRIAVSTHDCDGISGLDFEFINQLNKIN